MSTSVLVVEDDAPTREYFAEALSGQDEHYAVDTAASVGEAFAALERSTPDVLLVDLGLPDGSGLDLIRRARSMQKDVLPLVITVFGDESSVIGALEAGAQGYLLKSEAPPDLRQCVRQVLDGGAPISPGIASYLLRRFRDDGSHEIGDADRLHLTPRERQVLHFMVQGLPYQDAAEKLGITRNTVASYVKKIYQKLEVGSRGEAVYEALSQGIVTIDAKD